MRRRLVITLLVIILAAATVLTVKYWPRTASPDQCSALYRRYLHQGGIQASYLQGKTINDTLRVDVTLLQATSPSGWQRLCTDFNIPEPDSASLALLQQGNPDITLSILPPPPTSETDTMLLAASSHTLQCISIFHVTTPGQFDALVGHHILQLNQ